MPTQESQQRVSADLPPDLEQDPVTGDLLSVGRKRAAVRSFVDLVKTSFGSRPWQSNVGMRNVLFETTKTVDRVALEQSLEELAFNHAPEVILRDISVRTNGNPHQLKVFIEFSLRGFSDDRNLIEVDI